MKKDVLSKQEGIKIIHTGSYKNIGIAYKHLIDYSYNNNLISNNTFLTRFIKGSGKIFKGNENLYITEITLLLINKKGDETA